MLSLAAPAAFCSFTWTDSRSSRASGVKGVPLIRRMGRLKSKSAALLPDEEDPCSDFCTRSRDRLYSTTPSTSYKMSPIITCSDSSAAPPSFRRKTKRAPPWTGSFFGYCAKKMPHARATCGEQRHQGVIVHLSSCLSPHLTSGLERPHLAEFNLFSGLPPLAEGLSPLKWRISRRHSHRNHALRLGHHSRRSGRFSCGVLFCL